MKPGYRPPLTTWEEQEYRGGVWHTVASAVTLGLLIITLVSLA